MLVGVLLGVAVLVSVENQMTIGGVDDEKRWLSDAAAVKTLKGGEPAVLFDLGGLVGNGKLKAPVKDTGEGGPAPEFVVAVDSAKAAKRPVFAVTGGGKVLPHAVKLQATDAKVYLDEVAAWLATKGLKSEKAHLASVVRVDLDGDGADEVVLSAHPAGDYPLNRMARGGYSVVLLRKVVAGKVKTIVVYEEGAAKKVEGALLNKVELQALVDLDGDGTMELITSNDYYEGVGHCVYRISGEAVSRLGCVGFGA